MKRIVLIAIALTFSLFCFAQQKQSRVVLKSGTVFTGVITELDPTSHVKISVAGFETKIAMSDVASIEEVSVSPAPEADEQVVNAPVVDYPTVRFIQVGPYELELVLVKGGRYQMGYDGDGSMKMDSEPIHDVILSDYYINRCPLTKELVNYLKKGTVITDNRPFIAMFWQDANKIASALADATDMPFQLITESQWEYMATGDVRSILEIVDSEANFCNDFYGEYAESKFPVVDPKGPSRGTGHVIRFLAAPDPQIYGRLSTHSGRASKNIIRVSIPASAFEQ